MAGEEANHMANKRPVRRPAGERRSRNLYIADDVHDRLFFQAHRTRQTVSAVANDLLDKHLPRFRLQEA
jgi:hypothetical protein